MRTAWEPGQYRCILSTREYWNKRPDAASRFAPRARQRNGPFLQATCAPSEYNSASEVLFMMLTEQSHRIYGKCSVMHFQVGPAAFPTDVHCRYFSDVTMSGESTRLAGSQVLRPMAGSVPVLGPGHMHRSTAQRQSGCASDYVLEIMRSILLGCGGRTSWLARLRLRT